MTIVIYKQLSVLNCEFQNNTAAFGAGFSVPSSASVLYVYKSEFIDNNAIEVTILIIQ